MTRERIAFSSFRDPSGFVFRGEDGLLYRQVNHVYEGEYQRLMESGLYQDLTNARLLVEHEAVALSFRHTEDACVVLRPRMLPFISYPYEWCFSQLKDAALLTLDIQRRALDRGMSLKDCSAYNVQFDGTDPVFIDTLSFETYHAGAPWIAYGQFCRHFLAPLALMSATDVRLGRLLQQHIDGIPLDLAARLLPWPTRLRPGLLMHLHLHARAQERHVAREKACSHRGGRISGKEGRLTPTAFRGLIDSLESSIRNLSRPPGNTLWDDYYYTNAYTDATAAHKKQAVLDWLARLRPKTVWDLGANTGVYSRAAAAGGAFVAACDADAACVERNFSACRESGVRNVLPLWIDLTNPSPNLGWANAERASFLDRGPADAVLALALVHHFAIGNNVPLPQIAAFCRQAAPNVIVEFVPKADPQVRRLLASRTDIFPEYTQAGFEAAFQTAFTLVDQQRLRGCERIIYLMQAR